MRAPAPSLLFMQSTFTQIQPCMYSIHLSCKNQGKKSMHWVNRTALVDSVGEKWREGERGRRRERRERLVVIGWWFKGLAYLSSPYYWEMGMGILGGASQWPHTSYIVSLNRHLLYILALLLPQCNESLHPFSICQSDLCILHKSSARRRGKWNHVPCPLERILLVQSMYGKGSTPSTTIVAYLDFHVFKLSWTSRICCVLSFAPLFASHGHFPRPKLIHLRDHKAMNEMQRICRRPPIIGFVTCWHSCRVAYLHLVSLCVRRFSIYAGCRMRV